MNRTGRKLLAALLGVLAVVAMLATLLSLYTNHVLVSSGNFSNRALSALHTGDLESQVVQAVTDRIDAEARNDSSVQSVIQDAVGQALSNTEVDEEVSAAAASLQGQLVAGTADQLSLTLPNIGTAIASSIGSSEPQLAQEVRNIGTITVFDVRIPPSDAKHVHDLVSFGNDSSELLILTVVLILLALVISPTRRRMILGLGLGAVLGGLAAVVIYQAGRGIVVNEFSTQDAATAAHAVWSAYLGGLETWGFVLAGAGAAIACAGALAPRRRATTSWDGTIQYP